MDHARLVRGLERRAELEHDLFRPRPGHRTEAIELGGQLVSLEIFHREEDVLRRGLTEIGDVDDVLVADPRGGLGLVQEALDELAATRVLVVEDLERDDLLEHDVAREVHRAHATLADASLDPVALGQDSADQRVRRPADGGKLAGHLGANPSTIRCARRCDFCDQRCATSVRLARLVRPAGLTCM